MVRQITHPRSSTLSLLEQGYLAGLRNAGMSIYQIGEAIGIQDFRCILFFVLRLTKDAELDAIDAKLEADILNYFGQEFPPETDVTSVYSESKATT